MLTSSQPSRFYKTPAGFTLLEILSVVAIIATLATVIIVSVNGSNARAHDLRRLKDIETIQGAVEAYFSEYGYYPRTNCDGTHPSAGFDDGTINTLATCTRTDSSAGPTLAERLAPYLDTSSMHDPSHPTSGGYVYRSDYGTDYCIMDLDKVENLNDVPSTTVARTRCTGWDSSGKCNAPGTLSGLLGFSLYSNTIFVGNGPWYQGC